MAIFSRKSKTDKDNSAKPDKVEVGGKKMNETVDEKKNVSMKDLYESPGATTKAVAGKADKSGKKDRNEHKYGQAFNVLIKPLITEKATNVGIFNKYIFMVANHTNKIEVAKAIEEVYGIKPIKVNIVTVGGKDVRYGRITGKRRDWKKAIITLPAGKTINIYEGV